MNIGWTIDGCALTIGKTYYFNFRLVDWKKANGVFSCIEHLTPMGSGSTHIIQQQ